MEVELVVGRSRAIEFGNRQRGGSVRRGRHRNANVLFFQQFSEPLTEAVAGEPSQEPAVSAEARDGPRHVKGRSAGQSCCPAQRIDEDVHQCLAGDRDHGTWGSSRLAPVMIATASSIVVVAGLTRPAQRPSRWMWTRSATLNMCG